MARRVVLGAGGLGLAVVAAAVAARRASARWRLDDGDPVELLRLPGETTKVEVSDGAVLAVTDVGEGPAIVFSHGWTESRGVWAAVATRLLEQGHRVVLYDQRGHGESTVGGEGITVERLGADVADLVVALDLHDVVLAGHSMGGMSILSLLAHQPQVVVERARALVLVSTAASGLGRAPRLDAFAAQAMGSPVLTRLMSGPSGPRLVRGTVGRQPRYSHLAATATMFSSTPSRTRSDCLTAMTGMDLRPRLVMPAIPVTILVGSRDTLTPVARAKDIVERLPNATLEVVPDAGHQLPFERPDLVASILARAAAGAGAALPG